MTDKTSSSPVLAVLGGSFNPPHLGHALLPRLLLAQGGVERVLVAPCADHPLGKRLTPFDRRMSWTRLALAPDIRAGAVEVSAIEAELAAARDGQPSYSLALLQAVAARNPGYRVRLVVGSDITGSGETERWHRWDRIVADFEPIVVPRAGWCEPGAVTLPEVSSTAVRTQLEILKSGVDGRERERAERALRLRVPGSVADALLAWIGGTQARIVVVGRGHVAHHAVPWLWDRGFAVEQVGARALLADPERTLAALRAGGQAAGSGPIAGVWLLGRDGVLGSLATALAGRLARDTPVLHAAGARSARAVLVDLVRAGNPVGSLHPICSLRSERSRSRLGAASFGVEGDPEARALALRLVGGQPVLALDHLDARGRLAYHAACALVANHQAVLADRAAAVLRGQGHETAAIDRALGDLMLGSLENLLAAGIPKGVTGPLSRGDRKTVEAHLEALDDPDSRSLYADLSARLGVLLEACAPAGSGAEAEAEAAWPGGRSE